MSDGQEGYSGPKSKTVDHPMSEEMVTIPKKRYKELLRSEEILSLLEAGGVDNWEWYDESLSELSDEDEDSD